MTPGCHTAPGALLSSDTAGERERCVGEGMIRKEGRKEGGKERRGEVSSLPSLSPMPLVRSENRTVLI